MREKDKTTEYSSEKLALNLAIIGGGRTCKFFLDLIQKESFPYLETKILGVCDIDPEAEGLLLAKEMGIYTTDNFRDLFKIKGLNTVIELTNKREVLLELIRLRPNGVGVLEHNIGRLLRKLFIINQELKAAEQQVALQKEASNFLIQQTNERIVVIRPDFTIVEANAPYLKAVGKSKEETIGAHCYEITHGFSSPCSRAHPELGCPMVETMRTGQSAQIIHEHPFKEGRPTYCNLVAYPIKDQNGEIVQVIEIWRDITDELSSRWESRVNALKADMKKLVQEDRMISLGKLVASCVHEINNPIQGLLTFSHLMREILSEGTPGPEELKKFQDHLTIMCTELERCGNIISGLLSFSRESTIEDKKVDLNEIIDSVVTLTGHKMELHDIQLNTKLSSRPLVVRGDINQLQQCFLNLIFNAIEAMPQGGQLSVTSELDTAKKNCRVEIHDTGCGIRDEDLDNIFDPFFSTKEEGEGTGLGLSIVYGIVKNHRGHIEVKSQIGKGSSFILNFQAM